MKWSWNVIRASKPPSTNLASDGTADRLDSWKEVAAYLNKGARTVQRWEREEGLPVHRLFHDKLGSVYAYKAELDAWRAARGAVIDPKSVAEAVSAQSLAVLPFSDMSQEKDQAYFCDGLAEEIIHTLSGIETLRVASRTSSFQFRSSEVGSREIGRLLGVGSLLEGSVRKAGDHVRVAVQLVDARSGFHLWSDRYDHIVRDVFAIQDSVAQKIVHAVGTSLRLCLPGPPTPAISPLR